MKVYYPKVLNGTVQALKCCSQLEHIGALGALDQGGANNPLARLRARWEAQPQVLQKRLYVIFG